MLSTVLSGSQDAEPRTSSVNPTVFTSRQSSFGFRLLTDISLKNGPLFYHTSGQPNVSDATSPLWSSETPFVPPVPQADFELTDESVFVIVQPLRPPDLVAAQLNYPLACASINGHMPIRIEPAGWLALDMTSQALLRHLDGRHSLAGLADATGLDESLARLCLAHLMRAGVVRALPASFPYALGSGSSSCGTQTNVSSSQASTSGPTDACQITELQSSLFLRSTGSSKAEPQTPVHTSGFVGGDVVRLGCPTPAKLSTISCMVDNNGETSIPLQPDKTPPSRLRDSASSGNDVDDEPELGLACLEAAVSFVTMPPFQTIVLAFSLHVFFQF
ncbi:unnamed protein product [Protopolystoma xenopodis]|uniref:Uncharacterized protein n=1 Tax=Protopolystoma xenopodis TaxID=117903 RepID=A0A448XKT1_9PLAT|nr:unnamed protein product [Protopolystoma xenopodis]